MAEKKRSWIDLGDTVKDKLTGFKGVAVGRCIYLEGCDQILIQPVGSDETEYPKAVWIDEPRIVGVKPKDPVPA